ncbi:sensor histidine kinase [Diaphorobacter sp. HDW4A]|uniref:sensor histidine kinase n=1 Tax=Diaphorobacter sp. HDW4A TaxID=2714924 RepID=UPI00140D5C51|nr:sensor histidine kinase [Diaphorobacter sp. HDW4A]QIL80447.1 sensor histidine kinase [Diaphorobacter sp. HDW4A]
MLSVLFAYDSWSDTQALGEQLQKAYDQTLLEPAQALSDSLEWSTQSRSFELTDAFHITSMFEAVSARSKYLRVSVRSVDGKMSKVLLGPAQFPAPPTAGNDVAVRAFYTATVHDQPVRIAALQHLVHDDHGTPWIALIQTARSTYGVDAAQQELLMQALFKDLRTLGILVLIIWLGIGWGLRPLRSLREAIRTRKVEDLSPLSTQFVPGEVRPLVDAMNLHLAQQRDALESQRQFLADASHQLRTPLAIMHAQTGYALRETDPAAIRNTLKAVRLQLQRSRRVSEQLLSLAQAHQRLENVLILDDEVCDANRVAREVVIEHLPQASDKQIDLGWQDARGEEVDEDDDASPDNFVAPVLASALVLHEVLSNIVHNAIAYTQSGGRVSVSVRVNSTQVQMLVQDNGPGIAPQDRERAFLRFERLHILQDDAHWAPGSGLGLAIAKAYLQPMQGRIELLDGEDGTGLTVRIELPLRRSDFK